MEQPEKKLISDLQYSGEHRPMALHHHRGYEIIYVIQGEIRLNVGGSVLEGKGPCLVFIDLLDDHDVQVLSPVYERYYLTADPCLGEALGDRRKLLSLFCKGGAVYKAPPETKELFAGLFREFRQAQPYCQGVMCLKLTELFFKLFRQQPELEAAARALSPLVLGVRRCIETECTGSLTVKALADRFFVSEYHLIRVFKAQTGYTPKQFLIENRLSLAKEFLLHTGWDMERIAAETGFGDAGSLIRAFKKANGTTPEKYRKEGPEY